LHLTKTSENCWLDVDRERAERYTKKLEQDKVEAQKRLQGLQKRLENKNYVKQAPKELVDETRGQLTDTEQLIAHIENEISRYGSTEIS
jgi:valyl-tRNA synthetase